MMNIADLARTRYTTKVFEPDKRISDELMEQLKILLRFTPSSTNAQPWHFVVIGSEEGKVKTARATSGPYSGNEAKVKNASHVVVLCARNDLDELHLEQVLDQEERDGRFRSKEAKETQRRSRNCYVNLHHERGDIQYWMEKQVYIALGTLLLGAAALGIDTTPIEGFDYEKLDEEIGLHKNGLKPVVMAALGYRSHDDFNATLPKSSLPEEAITSFL